MSEQAAPAVSATAGTPFSFEQARMRLSAFFAQPAVRKSLPSLVGLLGLVGAALLYMTMSSGPQRILYSSLSDGDRAKVVETLEKGGIAYKIDNSTGALSVPEDDLYKARMLVASDGSVAAPETGTEMLDSIPLGASRTLEGERLRLARERELMMTIQEIDGIESVRVHLATPERSVFVRESTAPSASVMVRMASGRSLDKSQVDAIVNLVSGSVPGMSSGDVRVVDQHGQLLSSQSDDDSNGLTLQRQYEDKLREQIAQLLTPMLGAGNFSSEVQVKLDMNEVTSARESYDKDGVVRSESETSATRSTGAQPGGVPGVLSNTPPPPTQVANAAPTGTQAPASAPPGSDRESSAKRTFELGREVAVTSNRPGDIAGISVAVAISQDALKKIKPASEAKIKALVEAAVGADNARGDNVTVMVGKFDSAVMDDQPFYETAWFATILRSVVALLAVLLVLLLGVRPVLKMLRGGKSGDADSADGETPALDRPGSPSSPHIIRGASQAELREQVELARQLVAEKPERAVAALQRLLAAPDGKASQ